MKNKRTKIWFTFLMAIVCIFCFGMNVYAEEGDGVPKAIRFKTTINNWKDNNDLSFACGSASGNSQTITPKVYYATYDGSDLGTLVQVSCNFTLSSLDWDVGDSYQIIEEFDFTNYVGVAPEFEDIVVHPGHITSSVFESTDSIFNDYHPTETETAKVYNINHVDPVDGSLTGEGLYVYQAHIYESGSTEKQAEKDFGTIIIPTYCVKLNFLVRGTIASAYGTFVFNVFGDEDLAISSSVTSVSNPAVTFCELDGEPLSRSDVTAILDSDPADITYTGVSRADEYEMSIEEVGTETASGNTIITEANVIGRLDANLSQTGLGYRIIPFLILVGLVISGYFVIRKNKVHE